MKLGSKQIKFCEEYAVDLNATQAAIRSGYSEKTAYSQGQRLLKNVEIKKYLEIKQAQTSERNNVTIDYLIKEFKSIAEDDIKNYLDIDDLGFGPVISLKDNFSEINTRNIKKLQVGPKGELRIELYGRDNALIQLGRHVGFFNDKLDLNFDKMEESELDYIIERLKNNAKK